MSEVNRAERPSPEAMRQALADYVTAVHGAYLDAAALLPLAERGRLPLITADRLTVIAVGTSYLHVVGTVETLPAPSGQEVEISGSLEDIDWTLRFVDPVVLPAVGLIDEREGPRHDDVRRLLGIRTNLYHLAVAPGGGLDAHHAQHAGTGLAHSHAAAARDFEAIRAHAKGREFLVDDMAGAHVAGLRYAQASLATLIAPFDENVVALANSTQLDTDAIRRALLNAVRPSRTGVIS